MEKYLADSRFFENLRNLRMESRYHRHFRLFLWKGDEKMIRFFSNGLRRFATALLPALLFSGCAFWGGDKPLETLTYRSQDPSNESLIVFLRGRGGSHEDFAEEGFIDSVRQRGLAYDMMAPDAHLGYYFSETLVPRLKKDVVDPAKAQGYRRIWLVGVSMGGLGALMYTRSHPEDVAGVYLIAPFLGYSDIIDEIAEAGGVRSWSPGNYDPSEDWQRMLWDWLKTVGENPSDWPPIYLGYGVDDDFATAHGLLGEILPQDRIFETQGGHTPDAMKRAWLLFLDNSGAL